jgi:hypothetical protein
MQRRKHWLGVFVVSFIGLAGIACSSPPPPPPPVSAPTTGVLKATSEPPGATVLLDGNPGCAPTPCEMPNVAFGEHKIIFQHPEFEDFPVKEEVTADHLEVSAPFASKGTPKAPGKVKLVFEKEKPEKVKPLLEVVISGQETPLTLSDALEVDLSPGKKSIEIRRAGFAPITKEVEITSGGNLEVQIAKTELVGAKLTIIIDSSPVKGKVSVDGQDKGVAPVTVADLDASKAHSVVVKADTYSDYKTGVKWTKGPYEMKVNANLTQGDAAVVTPPTNTNGFLVVDTKPLTGMAIYIDGKKTKYTTPASSPGIKLSAGSHTVSFETGGKKSADFTVSIEDGKTLSKVFKTQ